MSETIASETMAHLTRLEDLTREEVLQILETAADLKTRWKNGERPPLLAGHVLTLLFEKPSLRTRNSFEAAMTHLGGHTIFLTTKEAGLQGREALADVARVLDGYSDAIAMRTFAQSLIDDFANHCGCPVINSLSDDRHPCQALTDLLTMREVLGDDLSGRTLVFVGDGNNVAASLAIATSMVGMRLILATPEGYELPTEFLAEVKTRHPDSDVTHLRDPNEAVAEADIVYTDVWASMGQEEESERRQAAFADYQVNAELMARAPQTAYFMHDLPAKRGLEVTDDVIDGDRSIVFRQAENRMHLAKGLLLRLVKGDNGT